MPSYQKWYALDRRTLRVVFWSGTSSKLSQRNDQLIFVTRRQLGAPEQFH
jgi:hypothetical protein